jgi:hypothetical protein
MTTSCDIVESNAVATTTFHRFNHKLFAGRLKLRPLLRRCRVDRGGQSDRQRSTERRPREHDCCHLAYSSEYIEKVAAEEGVVGVNAWTAGMSAPVKAADPERLLFGRDWV